MAVPDITNLTPDELVALIQQANAKYAALQAAQQSDISTRRQSAGAAVTTLTALLGPAGSPKGVGSIRAVRGYTGAEMAAAASTALPLIFQALEVLTATTLDLATIVASDQQ